MDYECVDYFVNEAMESYKFPPHLLIIAMIQHVIIKTHREVSVDSEILPPPSTL